MDSITITINMLLINNNITCRIRLPNYNYHSNNNRFNNLIIEGKDQETTTIKRMKEEVAILICCMKESTDI
jgi:hypothetical protein